MNYENYRPSAFKLLPDVVKNLLIINFIFFLSTQVVFMKFGLDLNDLLGLHYFESEKFRIYQFVTYMFMHGSWGHLFMNMLALWMFGSAVENIWGSKRFLNYYLLCGLGAAVAHYAIVFYEMQPAMAFINDYIANPHIDKLQSLVNSEAFQKFTSEELAANYNAFSREFNNLYVTEPAKALELSVQYMSQFKADVLNAPNVVGASGAVMGLLLAYGMIFPNSLIYVYFVLPIKAKYFVIIYGIAELFYGIAIPGDNVAHFAHVGGLITGFIIIQIWRNKNRRYRNDFYS